MNAEYKKVHVSMIHNGQNRMLVLHVVKPVNQEPLYFLFDYYGYAIDETTKVDHAAKLFESGKYTEIN